MISRIITLVPNLLHALGNPATHPKLKGQNGTSSKGIAVAVDGLAADILDGDRATVLTVDTEDQGDDIGADNNATSDKQTEADATAGWLASNATLSSVSSLGDTVPLFGAKMLRILATGANATGYMTITTVTGQPYTAVVWIELDAAETNVVRLRAGTTTTGNQLGSTDITQVGRFVRVELHFTATGTTTHINIKSITNGLSALVDMAYITDGDFRFDVGVASLADYAPDVLILDGHNLAAATELITNGDCEAAVPTFDGGAIAVTNGTVAQDTTRANGGTASAKFTGDGGNGEHGITDADVSGLGPGSVVACSIDVFIPATNTALVDLALGYKTGSNQLQDSTTTLGEWVTLTMVYIAPNDGSLANPFLLIDDTTQITAETFFYDNLSFNVLAPVSIRKHEVDNVDTGVNITIDRAFSGELGQAMIEAARHVSSLLAPDSSTNKLDLQGGVWPQLGFNATKGWQHITPDGLSRYLKRADTAAINFGANSDFGIRVVFSTETMAGGRMLHKGTNGAERYDLQFRTNGGFRARLEDTAGEGADSSGVDSTAITYNDGEIHDVFWTVDRDSATGNIIYTDGALDSTPTDPTAVGDIDSTNPLTVATSSHDPTVLPFDAKIYLVQLWNRAPSSAEVLTLYNGGDPLAIPAADRWGTSELMPVANDRSVTVAHSWANTDWGDFYDDTGGSLELRASGAGQFCTLPVASAPMTPGKKCRFYYTAASIAGTVQIQDFTGTQTFGTITANGTQDFLEFTVDAGITGGYRVVSVENDTTIILDDLSLIQVGCVAEWDFRSIGDVALPHADDLLYCELENSAIDLWYNLLVESAGFDFQADAETGYVILGKGFSVNKIVKNTFRSGPAFPGIRKRRSSGGVPKGFEQFGEQQRFVWTYGALTDAERAQLVDTFRLSRGGKYPTYMKIVEDGGAPKIHKLFFDGPLIEDRRGGRWNIAVSFTEYPR